MNTQSELFKVPEVVSRKPIPVEQLEDERYTESYCLNHLETVTDLWDMRAWLNHKDKAEVAAYVHEPEHKNSGHSQFCVERLKEKFRTPEARIVQAVMNNPHIMYKNRLGACMIKDNCPRLKNAGGDYSKCACWKCTNKQVEPKEVKFKWED